MSPHTSPFRCLPRFTTQVLSSALLAGCFGLAAQAQSPPLVPTPAPGTTATAPPAATPESTLGLDAGSQLLGTPMSDDIAVPTLKLSARRVVVDITVTDAHGKPITGLTEADFHVTEDGKPQKLRSFELHTVEPPSPIAAPKLPVNTFSNLTSAPAGGSITVILYDLLNTPLDAQPYAHEELLSFLKNRKNSGEIAIFVLTDRLHMLQGFTDDDNRLIAALSLQKTQGFRSALAAGTPGQQQSGAPPTQVTAPQNGGQTPGQAPAEASVQNIALMLDHISNLEQSNFLDRRVDLTAAALQEVARFLISLPGRKNLLWMSAAFPSGIFPNNAVDGAKSASGGSDEFGFSRIYSNEIKLATDMLNLSHVAVYPIDVRGLVVPGPFSAATPTSANYQSGQGQVAQATQNFQSTLASEHTTMDTIGVDTGGRAFYNTNGLKEAAAEAIAEGSVYYTVSYTPSNNIYDGNLRKVHVDLTNPGYHLQYRRSYFGNGIEELARAQEDAPTDSLSISLEHGAPAAHELFFEAHVIAQGTPYPASPEDMTTLEAFEAQKANKKRKTVEPILLQRYSVTYAMLPRQLDLRVGSDANRRGSFDFAAKSYNVDGKLMLGTRLKVQDVIKPERWKLIEDDGYWMVQQLIVPTQARSLRIAVRDASTDHIGSLELSLPLPPEPTAAAAPSAEPAPASPTPAPPASSPPAS